MSSSSSARRRQQQENKNQSRAFLLWVSRSLERQNATPLGDRSTINRISRASASHDPRRVGFISVNVSRCVNHCCACRQMFRSCHGPQRGKEVAGEGGRGTAWSSKFPLFHIREDQILFSPFFRGGPTKMVSETSKIKKLFSFFVVPTCWGRPPPGLTPTFQGLKRSF